MNLRDLSDNLEKLLQGFQRQPQVRRAANVVTQPFQGAINNARDLVSNKPASFHNRVLQDAGRQVANTAIDFGKLTLGAGYEGQRAVRAGLGDQRQYGVDPVSGKAYNTNPFLNEQTLSKYSNPITGAMDAGGKTFKLAATVYGLPKVTIGSALAVGGLGGGANVLANKFTGNKQTPLEALQKGISGGLASAPMFAGIGRVTNPAITKYANIVGNKFASEGMKQVATRIAAGAMNIPEGAIMGKSVGAKGYSPTDALLDFSTGFALGKPVSRAGNSIDQAVQAMPKGFHPRANKIHNMDAADLTEAMDTLLLKGSDQMARRKAMDTVQNIINAYAPGYKNASTEEMYRVSEWLLNQHRKQQQNFDIPKMGLVDDGVGQERLTDIDLYHMTPSENVESINREGFRIGKGKGIGHNLINGVFFTKDKGTLKSNAFDKGADLSTVEAKLSKDAVVKKYKTQDELIYELVKDPEYMKIGVQNRAERAEAALQIMRRKGIDAIEKPYGNGVEVIVLNPDKIEIKPNVAQQQVNDIPRNDDPFSDNNTGMGFVDSKIKMAPEPKITMGRVDNSPENTIDGLAKEARKYKTAQDFINNTFIGKVQFSPKGNAKQRELMDTIRQQYGGVEEFFNASQKIGKIAPAPDTVTLGQRKVQAQVQPSVDNSSSQTPVDSASNLASKNSVAQSTDASPKTVRAMVDDVAKIVKGSTDAGQARRFEVSAKGKVITNKAGSKLEKGFLDRMASWKDKPKVLYQRERLDRNIEDVAGDDAPEMIERFFKPVQRAEADRQRWLKSEKEQIQALGVKGNTKESQLLQQFGEKKVSVETLKKELPQTWEKVVNAEKVFRQKYDQYLVDINKVLTRNGYDPIPKRVDYFVHFQDISNVLERFGIPVRDNTLPTDLNGLTADFKPGKNFFVHALQRKGDLTDFDAIKGIDRYLEGASKQIFHTDNIQNLRLLENGIRDRFAGTTHLSNFASNLTEYINNLAGKKAMLDRGVEDFVGRNVYGAAQKLRSQVGANMVGANIASSLTNFIPLTQSLATTSKPAFVKGLLGATLSPIKDDGFSAKSDFLTRRLGTDKLYTGAWESIANKGGWIFKTIDRFVSETVTRGKYHEGLSKGLSPEQAMKQADDYASRLVGDRSLGSMPNLFNSKTAAFLTQFQLEVNNQVSFLFKDIPSMNNGNKLKIASALGQVALYSYLYNEMYEKAFGRRPAFDPLGIAQDTYEDYTNPDMKKGQTTKNLAESVVNQVPFANSLTGGRIPIGAAIPNPLAILKGESTIGKEILKPATYLLPPTGGGQVKKTFEGLKAYAQGASTSAGGGVRFPIEKTPANFLRTAIGGQYASPDAREYFREGRTPLGKDQTEIFKSMGASDQKNYYDSVLNERSEGRKVDRMVEDAKLGEEGGMVGTILVTSDGKKIDLAPPTKGEGIDAYVNQNWKYTKAREVFSSKASSAQKATAYKQLGVDAKDVEYDYKASKSNDIKAQYVIDKAKSLTRQQFLERMYTGRVESVTGSRFISDGVIDQLEDAGLLSDAEAKALKKIKYDSKGNSTAKASGGKGKKINLSDAPKVNIKISGSGAPMRMSESKFLKNAPPKIAPFKIRKISDMIKIT